MYFKIFFIQLILNFVIFVFGKAKNAKLTKIHPWQYDCERAPTIPRIHVRILCNIHNTLLFIVTLCFHFRVKDKRNEFFVPFVLFV